MKGKRLFMDAAAEEDTERAGVSYVSQLLVVNQFFLPGLCLLSSLCQFVYLFVSFRLLPRARNEQTCFICGIWNLCSVTCSFRKEKRKRTLWHGLQ